MRARFLDGLRGLASLIVVFDHFAISFFPAAVDIDVGVHHSRWEWLIERTPLHILVAGNFSVCIFFVLSGFVLSTRYFVDRDQRAVLSMAARRYLRLALPVAASVLMAFGLLKLHAFRNTELAEQTGSVWLLRFWRESPTFLQTLYHGFIGVFIGGKSDQFNTVLWTMKTELLGSFLVFGLFIIFGSQKWRYIAYAFLTIVFYRSYLIAFVAGTVLADLYALYGSRALSNRYATYVWVSMLTLGLYMGSAPVDSLRLTPFSYLHVPGVRLQIALHVVGAVITVAGLLLAKPLQKFLQNKWLTYLGDISFGLYLTHMFVIGTLTSLLFVRFSHLSYGWRFMVTVLPSLLVMWGLAHVFMKYIDKKAVAASTWWYKWVSAAIKRLVAGSTG